MNLNISSVRAENTTIADKKYPNFIFKNNNLPISRIDHRETVSYSYSFTSSAQELHIRSSLDKKIDLASSSQAQPSISSKEIPAERIINKKKSMQIYKAFLLIFIMPK